MKAGVQKGIILALMAAAVAVGIYFGYINRKPSSSEEPVVVGEVQEILMLDYERKYPPTPRETVNAFCRIYKVLYGEAATDEQALAMGEKLKALFDRELVEYQFDYEASLLQEIRRKKKDGYTVSSYRTQSAAETESRRVDGNDLTYVQCMITMRKGSQLYANNYLFVLRREQETGRWKIFGWTVVQDDD